MMPPDGQFLLGVAQRMWCVVHDKKTGTVSIVRRDHESESLPPSPATVLNRSLSSFTTHDIFLFTRFPFAMPFLVCALHKDVTSLTKVKLYQREAADRAGWSLPCKEGHSATVADLLLTMWKNKNFLPSVQLGTLPPLGPSCTKRPIGDTQLWSMSIIIITLQWLCVRLPHTPNIASSLAASSRTWLYGSE